MSLPMMNGSDVGEADDSPPGMASYASPPSHAVLQPEGESAAPVREIRRLNTLRGVAVLIVLVSHYSDVTKFHPWLGAGGGIFGVMLFFLLSGFLMAYLYYDQTPHQANLRNFLVARLARVVPLYYFMVLLSFVSMHWAPLPLYQAVYGIQTVPELVSHLLFLHGMSVLWTIPPEIQFYLLFAAAWALKNTLRTWLAALLAAILVADFFLGFPLKTYSFGALMVDSNLAVALPYFIIGSVFGYGYRHWRYPQALHSHLWVLALLVIPLLFPLIFQWLTGHQHAMWSDVGVIATMSAVFYAVVFLVPEGNKLLENKIGDFMGRISYSVYLLHLPVLIQFLRHAWSGDNTSFLAYLATTLIVASLSFVCIEVPSRRLLRHLFHARTNYSLPASQIAQQLIP